MTRSFFLDDKKGLQLDGGSGTGFLVNDQNLVITNRHVAIRQLANGNFEKFQFLKIAYVNNGKLELVDAEVLSYSTAPREDIAYLRPAKKLPGKPLKLADYDPKARARVTAVGFPGVSDVALEKNLDTDVVRGLRVSLESNKPSSVNDLGRLYWESYSNELDKRFKSNAQMFSPTWTEGNVTKVQPIDKVQIVQHQTPINPGNSGGPLIDECGNVVGINTWSTQSQGTNRSPASTWMIENAVAYKPFTGGRCLSVRLPSEWQFLASPAAIVSFASLLTALLAIAMLFAFRRNPVVQRGYTMLTRAKPRDNRDMERTARPGAGRPDMAKSVRPEMPPMGAGSGTIAVPGLGNDAGASPYQTVPPSSAVVRLVPTGAGSPIALSVAQLTRGGILGREGDMGFVLSDQTVSKRHAKLSFERGALVVEDLNSVNGTYKGRTKITRDSFASGDTIKFGSLEFRVELPGGAAGGGARNAGVDATVASASAAGIASERGLMISGLDQDGRKIQMDLRANAARAWTLGRKAGVADLVVNHPRVSSEHARIRFTPDRGFEIADMGSTNGTKLDGQPVEREYVSLETARKLHFGDLELQVNRT